MILERVQRRALGESPPVKANVRIWPRVLQQVLESPRDGRKIYNWGHTLWCRSKSQRATHLAPQNANCETPEYTGTLGNEKGSKLIPSPAQIRSHLRKLRLVQQRRMH